MKIGLRADFHLWSFVLPHAGFHKTPAKACITAASMPPKASGEWGVGRRGKASAYVDAQITVGGL